ncbi:hypothetical protein KR054_007894, partial [Drosophila jambulina]
SSADGSVEVPSFRSESYGVPITFSSPRSREALFDFMVATIQAKDLRTCSTLVMCQQNAEARHVKSEMGKRNINTVLLEADHPTTHHMLRLWSQGYIQQVIIACDDHLKLLEGIPINFVIHTALPPVEKFRDRLNILTKSETKAEMLAFIFGDPKEKIGSLQSQSSSEKGKNGKTPKLVVKPLNIKLEEEIVWSPRALTRGNGTLKGVPDIVPLEESLPEEPEFEGWQTPPEVQTDHSDHVGSIQRQMDVTFKATGRLSTASPVSCPKASSLGSTKGQSSRAASAIALERDGMSQTQFGVVVWSRDQVVPCYDITGVPDLNPSIRDTMMAMMENMKDRQARGLQRYAWPHVVCGKSLVAVGPEMVGKTWCFLPSLCQRTHEMLLRSEEPYGPTSIVVCVNQQQGNQILQWIVKLLGPLSTGSRIPYEQVVTLWEKGNVQEVADRLSHPVGILVTTPEMLVLLKELHTKKKPIFNANSIKCLALDNLSDMMRQQPDTTAKMLDWIIQLFDFGADGCQLFVTTRLWPETLMRESLLPRAPDVLIAFKEPLEATIFGRAGLEVNLIKPGEESSSLVQMLRDRSLNEDRIVVICQTKEEVQNLKHKLVRAGIRAEAVYADGGLHTVGQWRLRRLALILLLTDDILNKVKCGPIDLLIHFTPASNWTKFKFRFSLLYNNYVSSVEGSPGKSVVMLQQSDFDSLWQLADFMIWHQLPRPDHWLRVLAESRQKEEKPSSELAKISLCEHIASYGDCFRRTCRNRHVMWREEVLSPAYYPTEGDFRFLVLSCMSPAHVSVRLNELYPTKVAFLNFPMSQLGHELHVYYELEQNRRQHPNPKVGEIVIVKNLNRYERVVIVETDDRKIIVRLMDTGIDVLRYRPSQIFVCEEPLIFRQIEPRQAMEVRLIGIEPANMDRIWTRDMREVVRAGFFSRLKEKQMRIFTARVKFVLSRTVFVQTVVDDKGQDLRSFLLDRFGSHVHEEARTMEKLKGVVYASQPSPKD